jgi:hydrogenase nickel incorporation protein HypA/HybF
MHELSVATAVLNTVLKHADGRPVEVVAMRVGQMRQVVPHSLRFYWEIVARDTICEDSELELTEITTRLQCRDCDFEWEPLIPAFRCPGCEGSEVSVIAGQELEVEHIEVKEAAHA